MPPPCMTPEERRRRDRERKRLGRFLKRGGIVQREEIGGAVGERWASADRCSGSFEPMICSAWLQKGRLEPVTEAVGELFRARAKG